MKLGEQTKYTHSKRYKYLRYILTLSHPHILGHTEVTYFWVE
jgi:hypothetical protein